MSQWRHTSGVSTSTEKGVAMCKLECTYSIQQKFELRQRGKILQHTIKIIYIIVFMYITCMYVYMYVYVAV